MERLLHIVVTLALLLVAAASAGAQNSAESNGNSIDRIGIQAVNDPFHRPGLFFLGRAERALPPAFATSYPFVRIEAREGPEFLYADLSPLVKNEDRALSALSVRHPVKRLARHGRKSVG